MFNWTDISTTGTEIWVGQNQDDAFSSALSIGFNFPFYGTNETQFMISANGFICLGTAQAPYFQGFPRFNYKIVAPNFGDNYHVANVSRYYYQTLTSPNRLVVQFNDVRYYSSSYRNNAAYGKTYQIILYETGVI
ncbi:MAG: hypothetical protein N2450_06870 [bacterium]|nr:hypothetical protein [bacterium]